MSFQMPVEAGHILTFARAIGDDNPVFSDFEAARAAGFPAVVAPPTFVEAGAHFDPESIVRPLEGKPWFGSGALPCGDPSHEQSEPGSTFHAETHFTYHQPLLFAGQALTATERPGTTWTRTGRRGGSLSFKDWFVDYTDAADRLLVTARTVAVSTESKVPPASHLSQRHVASPFPGIADSSELRSAIAPQDLVLGATKKAVVLRDLTRARIVQYAGASGDFSPQHTDEVYNTQSAGYPTVFAHGMLTMGAAGRLLTDWLGVGSLREFGARFLGQVWPGDSLLAEATVVGLDESDDGRRVKVEFVVVDQLDQPVLSGSASATIANVPSAC